MSKVMVVLPTYNEAENLPVVVRKIIDLRIDGLEILVVDDDSPDGTGQIADYLSTQWEGKVHVLHRKDAQRGLGLAYFDGFKQALDIGVDYVIGMDADLSHSPEHIPEMLEQISNCDMVVGSRYIVGGGVDKEWGRLRKLLSCIAQKCSRLLLHVRTSDVTGAFRCYRAQTLRSLRFDLMNLNGYVFLIEIILQAERMGMNIGEIPITFHVRNAGESKITFQIIWRAFRRVAAIRSVRYDQLPRTESYPPLGL